MRELFFFFADFKSQILVKARGISTVSPSLNIYIGGCTLILINQGYYLTKFIK